MKTMTQLLKENGIAFEKDAYNTRAYNITNAYGEKIQIWSGGGQWIIAGLTYVRTKEAVIEELKTSYSGRTRAIEYAD